MPKRFMAYIPGTAPVVVTDTTAPTVPTGVISSGVNGGGFTVTWNPSTDAVGVAGYVVQANGATVATTPGTFATVTGLNASTTYAVRIQAYDAAGNYSALSTAVSVTTTSPNAATLFSTQTPATPYANDNQGITLSTRFSSDIDGALTGMRFYRPTTAPTTAIGLAYSDVGVELARATFGSLAVGWNSVTFPSPIAVTAGTKYRVAYFSDGPYTATSGLFASPVVSGHLTGTSGFYEYGATPTFPTQSFNSGAYFADPLFIVGVPTAPATPAAPITLAGDSSILVSWTAPANGGSAITGYDVQSFAGATAGPVISLGNVLSTTISGLTNGTAYTIKVRATNANGSSAYSAASEVTTPAVASASSGSGEITHGDQLTINHVGPWTLQSVARGSETMLTPTLPSRGYWLMDTSTEWAKTTPYVYNNLASNTGGVVPAGGMTIDGYVVPAGTIVAQFRDFSAGDFSAQGQAGQYLFRGCRFRANGIGQSSQFNDYTATYTNRLFYCDMGGKEPASLSTWQMSFWKAIGGSNHIVYRTYMSAQYVSLQMNANNFQAVENYITDLTWYYGDTTPPGQGEPLHMSSVGAQGGVTGLRVLRNRITCPSPDPLGTTFTQGAALTFGNDIDVPWSNVWVKDNFLSGMGFVIRLFGEVAGQNNLQVTGNKVTSRWFTEGGASGVAQLGDHPVVWGSSGNIKSNNTWADDYGSGGTGTGTALSARQYPAGNGPRVGTIAF